LKVFKEKKDKIMINRLIKELLGCSIQSEGDIYDDFSESTG
jgi:hypothetical protein